MPGNVYQGFDSRLQAEQAYRVAYAMGAVRRLYPRGVPAPALEPAVPTPDELMDAINATSDTFLGAQWHVVFQGRRPGIYPAWYVYNNIMP